MLAPEAVALHAELVRACQPCHREGGPAAMTRYKLGGQTEVDLGASRAFVDTGNPTGSPLVSKAAGQPHGGGAIWPPGSPGQKVLLAWIAAGAPDRPPAPAPRPPERLRLPPRLPLRLRLRPQPRHRRRQPPRRPRRLPGRTTGPERHSHCSGIS